jgi:hypothetical protein
MSVTWSIWHEGGECVGVTDGGSYVFRDFAAVQERIRAENEKVRRTDNYVNVALLTPLTLADNSAMSLDKTRHALEGAYLAQHRANNDPALVAGDREPKIQLLLANVGSHQDQWRSVVGRLVTMTDADHPLVAVVGMGVSVQQTKDAAEELSHHQVPMVSAVVTADGLDSSIPGLIRVAPSNADYVEAVRWHLQTRRDLRTAMLVYDGNSDLEDDKDLYTGTLREDFEEAFDFNFPSQPFTGSTIESNATPHMFSRIRSAICSTKPDKLFFAGREIDLDVFLQSLGGRECVRKRITIISGATGFERILSRRDELARWNLEVVHAASVDTRAWDNESDSCKNGVPEHYADFRTAFNDGQNGFPHDSLADGYAIMHHDALLAAATAIRLAAPNPSAQIPKAVDVGNQLLGLNAGHSVQGASGELSFSRETNGNPGGKPVPVIYIPPSSERLSTCGEVHITGLNRPKPRPRPPEVVSMSPDHGSAGSGP